MRRETGASGKAGFEMKRQRMGWILGALAVLLTGCGPEAASSGGAGGQADGTKAAPEIALPLKKGAAPVALSAWKGKVVILDFWATWCGPCRGSIPEIERVYKKYHAKGLEVVGISIDETSTAADIPAAVKELGMTYPVVLGSDIPDLRTKYEFTSIPQMFIIDRKGHISEAVAGWDPSGSSLDAKVEALLNEKG